MEDNNRNDHMYFIKMGIKEFANEASQRIAEEFNLDYSEVKIFFDELVDEMTEDEQD